MIFLSYHMKMSYKANKDIARIIGRTKVIDDEAVRNAAFFMERHRSDFELDRTRIQFSLQFSGKATVMY